MKRLFICSVIYFFAIHVQAQRVRVFEHLSVGYAFGDAANVPSLAYTQTLAFGNKFGIRFQTGVRYSYYILRKEATLESTDNLPTAELRIEKGFATSVFNIPVGLEIGNRILAVGVNTDLIGFSLLQQRNSDYFSINGVSNIPQELFIAPAGFNFLPTRKGTTNGHLYASVTPNPTMTIKLGMALTQSTFTASFTDTEDNTSTRWREFKEQAFRPFVGLQFNFEK